MSASSDSLSDKAYIEHKEDVAADVKPQQEEEAQAVDPKFAIRVRRKIDLRLIPILAALYCISLIDRTNISVARVAGMAKDLKLTVGERYSIVTCVFFVPYIIFELPSNLIIRKVGCRNQLSTIVILWGAVMTGMAFCKTWQQLAVCRVLLGCLEAGFFPGCVYLIATWYKRYEQSRRFAWFYLASMCMSGFSKIIGYGMSLLAGRGGLNGWQWIFLLFGVVTIALGIISIFLIVDFPDKAKFLTPEEKAYAIQRVQEDRGDAIPDEMTLAKIGTHMCDLKLWAFGMCFMCSTAASYAFSYFLPVILSGAGYSTKMSLMLSAPPYVFGAVYTAVSAHFSDRYRQRALFIGGASLMCMIGLFLMAFVGPIAPRYLGAFFTIAGCQCNVPAIIAYQNNNILSHSKRSVGSALTIGLGGVGGIFASLVYREADYPKYLPGLGATIGCQATILIILALLSFHFRRCNKRADEGTFVIEGNPRFRYTI
ncbi:hypothetical protein BMF94_6064 [Rhodotorula taiwanensis]|uniref:Major facilitator superfamily (MFS) profile domain-containing protein n=1 Tax=Rhodotorula taiwanensis TaxID=741276 RepID=A0A2S5B280_9BASI|nr:hypothetical protein BMF94_6064 [Rhodotorula taiwanensis]